MHKDESTIQPPVKKTSTALSFEEQYIAMRNRENWLCSDEELKQLPVVPRTHPHYREWKIRERSLRLLIQYLQKKKSGLRILEIGCGNGWLTSKLAAVPGSKVTGTDINHTELRQAERIFGHHQNILFLYGDVREHLLKKNSYDVIVFAASIQYFPWLNEIVHTAFELLAPDGEIHIIDSPFYNAAARSKAVARSAAYFNTLGFPSMSDHYFHHILEDMEQFRSEILYDPHAWYRQLLPASLTGPINPFHWIRIRHD